MPNKNVWSAFTSTATNHIAWLNSVHRSPAMACGFQNDELVRFAKRYRVLIDLKESSNYSDLVF